VIKVPFDPDELAGEDRAWWDAWSEKAERRLRSHLDEGAALDSSIWSELKKWLLEKVFHGKCAYCEVQVTAGSFGDAEHYRPKGNVTAHDGRAKRQAVLANGQPHPGYSWLAYDWRNLVPACGRCNNAKSDQFEVDGDYLLDGMPDTRTLNEAERPRLLYPYEDDPTEYLRFGAAGVVTAINGNARGRATIRLLGLDRRELTEERWRHQSSAIDAMESPVGGLLGGDEPIDDRARRYMARDRPFSRAVHDWFVERAARISARALAAAARIQADR
jgi:uncharacterized protein (TIGR02646 family)